MSAKARWAALLVGLLVFIAGLILVTTSEAYAKINGKAYKSFPAVEDTRLCVTNAEWNQLEPWMRRVTVREILDGAGTYQSEKTWWYPVCDLPDGYEGRVITVYNDDWRLKQAYHIVTSGTFEKKKSL